MYHALAYSGIMCIQALLKFEQVQYDYIAFIMLDTVSWNDASIEEVKTIKYFYGIYCFSKQYKRLLRVSKMHWIFVRGVYCNIIN